MSGFRVLDVGCGGGFISEALAREGAEVLGVDISDKVIEVRSADLMELILIQTLAAEQKTFKGPPG